MDLLKASPGQKSLESKEKSVLVSPLSLFTKQPNVFTKILGFEGRGSEMTSNTKIDSDLRPRSLASKGGLA